MWQIWLVISALFMAIEIVTVVIEIFTTGFLVFWFSIGAIIALIVSLFTDNIIIQTLVFLATSVILLFATKPFVQKFIRSRCKNKCIFS